MVVIPVMEITVIAVPVVVVVRPRSLMSAL
jgi:hypothetical protein